MKQPSTDRVVSELLDILDPEIVALIGHASNISTVNDWRSGRLCPEHADRLAAALDVASFMRSAGESPDVIDAWFRGLNSALNDSPAIVLADASLAAARREVMAAARAFICR